MRIGVRVKDFLQLLESGTVSKGRRVLSAFKTDENNSQQARDTVYQRRQTVFCTLCLG